MTNSVSVKTVEFIPRLVMFIALAKISGRVEKLTVNVNERGVLGTRVAQFIVSTEGTSYFYMQMLGFECLGKYLNLLLSAASYS